MKKTKTFKGVGYLRVSDKKQEDNHSIDIQKQQIERLAEKENIEIVSWRSDIAKSAYRMNISKRDGIKQVLEDIEAGIDSVCFYEESRITRSITDFFNEVYMPIKERHPNTRFFSTQYEGEWDPNDPIVQAKLLFAAEESETKSIRAKDTQLTLLSRETPTRPGSTPPLGYDMTDGVLQPNDEQKIVELIYDFSKWGHSDSSISKLLNAAKISTKKIKHWNASTINYILNNPVYRGHLKWNIVNSNVDKNNNDTKIYYNVHEPLVSETTVKLLDQTKEFKKKFGMLKTPFSLRGILSCKCCGNELTTKNNTPKGSKRKYLSYHCRECNQAQNVELVHKLVFNNLLNKWLHQLDTLAKSSRKQLIDWKKELLNAKKPLQTHYEKTLINERSFSAEISEDTNLSNSFAFTKQYLQAEIKYLDKAIKGIEALLNDQSLINFFTNLKNANFNNLLEVEVRCLSLIFFDTIKIDFNNNNNVEIDYRINPFVQLEKIVGYNTEKIDKLSDLTS